MGRNNKNKNHTLTVLQWNCQSFTDHKRAELFQEFEEQNQLPDVLCMQEISRRIEIRGYTLITHKTHTKKKQVGWQFM